MIRLIARKKDHTPGSQGKFYKTEYERIAEAFNTLIETNAPTATSLNEAIEILSREIVLDSTSDMTPETFTDTPLFVRLIHPTHLTFVANRAEMYMGRVYALVRIVDEVRAVPVDGEHSNNYFNVEGSAIQTLTHSNVEDQYRTHAASDTNADHIVLTMTAPRAAVAISLFIGYVQMHPVFLYIKPSNTVPGEYEVKAFTTNDISIHYSVSNGVFSLYIGEIVPQNAVLNLSILSTVKTSIGNITFENTPVDANSVIQVSPNTFGTLYTKEIEGISVNALLGYSAPKAITALTEITIPYGIFSSDLFPTADPYAVIRTTYDNYSHYFIVNTVTLEPYIATSIGDVASPIVKLLGISAFEALGNVETGGITLASLYQTLSDYIAKSIEIDTAKQTALKYGVQHETPIKVAAIDNDNAAISKADALARYRRKEDAEPELTFTLTEEEVRKTYRPMPDGLNPSLLEDGLYHMRSNFSPDRTGVTSFMFDKHGVILSAIPEKLSYTNVTHLLDSVTRHRGSFEECIAYNYPGIKQIDGYLRPLIGVHNTYYVDPSTGSDTNDGLSEDAPFKSYQAAYDTAGPGDDILFKRGEIISFTDTIPVKNNTILGAYGKGHMPILTDREKIDDVIITEVDADTYELTSASFTVIDLVFTIDANGFVPYEIITQDILTGKVLIKADRFINTATVYRHSVEHLLALDGATGVTLAGVELYGGTEATIRINDANTVNFYALNITGAANYGIMVTSTGDRTVTSRVNMHKLLFTLQANSAFKVTGMNNSTVSDVLYQGNIGTAVDIESQYTIDNVVFDIHLSKHVERPFRVTGVNVTNTKFNRFAMLETKYPALLSGINNTLRRSLFKAAPTLIEPVVTINTDKIQTATEVAIIHTSIYNDTGYPSIGVIGDTSKLVLVTYQSNMITGRCPLEVPLHINTSQLDFKNNHTNDGIVRLVDDLGNTHERDIKEFLENDPVRYLGNVISTLRYKDPYDVYTRQVIVPDTPSDEDIFETAAEAGYNTPGALSGLYREAQEITVQRGYAGRYHYHKETGRWCLMSGEAVPVRTEEENIGELIVREDGLVMPVINPETDKLRYTRLPYTGDTTLYTHIDSSLTFLHVHGIGVYVNGQGATGAYRDTVNGFQRVPVNESMLSNIVLTPYTTYFLFEDGSVSATGNLSAFGYGTSERTPVILGTLTGKNIYGMLDAHTCLTGNADGLYLYKDGVESKVYNSSPDAVYVSKGWAVITASDMLLYIGDPKGFNSLPVQYDTFNTLPLPAALQSLSGVKIYLYPENLKLHDTLNGTMYVYGLNLNGEAGISIAVNNNTDGTRIITWKTYPFIGTGIEHTATGLGCVKLSNGVLEYIGHPDYIERYQVRDLSGVHDIQGSDTVLYVRYQHSSLLVTANGIATIPSNSDIHVNDHALYYKHPFDGWLVTTVNGTMSDNIGPNANHHPTTLDKTCRNAILKQTLS